MYVFAFKNGHPIGGWVADGRSWAGLTALCREILPCRRARALVARIRAAERPRRIVAGDVEIRISFDGTFS